MRRAARAASLGYRLNGDDTPPVAGDGPESLGNRLDGEDTPPGAPGSRIIDWFLQNHWAQHMLWTHAEHLVAYGIQLTVEEVRRGKPWDLRPWPPPKTPKLRTERIFGPLGGPVAGGDWVLPTGELRWRNLAGPMRNAPGPSRPPSVAAGSRATVGPLPREGLGARWRAVRTRCKTCSLRSCFCLKGQRPTSYAIHGGARPVVGTPCCGSHFFCICADRRCGARA